MITAIKAFGKLRQEINKNNNGNEYILPLYQKVSLFLIREKQFGPQKGILQDETHNKKNIKYQLYIQSIKQ